MPQLIAFNNNDGIFSRNRAKRVPWFVVKYHFTPCPTWTRWTQYDATDAIRVVVRQCDYRSSVLCKYVKYDIAAIVLVVYTSWKWYA